MTLILAYLRGIETRRSKSLVNMQGLWPRGDLGKAAGGGSQEPSRRPQARDILTILQKTAISVETSSISGRGRKSRSPNAI